MDKESPRSAPDAMYLAPPQVPSLKVEDVRSWSPSHYSYQSAGARSTRMIIESSSYQTTPYGSPPKESLQSPNVERFGEAGCAPQEIARSSERRSYANSPSHSVQVDRNSNCRDKVGETQPCDLAATKELLRGTALDERPAEKHNVSTHVKVVPKKYRRIGDYDGCCGSVF
jgi:hypothetical protein